MTASPTATCSRCGHGPPHHAKPYVRWGLAMRGAPAWHGLFLVVYNRLVAVLAPRMARLFVVPRLSHAEGAGVLQLRPVRPLCSPLQRGDDTSPPGRWPALGLSPRRGGCDPSTRLLITVLIIIFMHGSEQHFRTTLGQERASVLLEALETSSERARALAAREGFGESRTEPAVAFDFAVASLTEGLAPLEGVRSAQVSGQHFWIVDDCYALRVKKLRSGYRSSNHHSQQQELISRQSSLPGLGQLIYVTAGAFYSDRTGLAEAVVVLKYRKGPMSRQQVEWVVDLHDLAAGGMVPGTPILPLPTVPAAPAAVSAKRASDQILGDGHQEG